MGSNYILYVKFLPKHQFTKLNNCIEIFVLLILIFNMKISALSFKGMPANYYVIDKYVSRSAQPNKEDFLWLKQQGVTDIINFRTMYAKNINFDEKKVVENLGLKYHNIPTISEYPSETKVQEFLNLVDNVSRNKGKAHIHCYAGADRTGLYAFIYKIKKGIGTLQENKQEWIKRGHNTTLYPKLIPWAENFVRKYYSKRPPCF